MAKKRGLGRNLEALLGGNTASIPGMNSSKISDALSEPLPVEPLNPSRVDGQLKNLPLEQIKAGKYQPRKDFADEALNELAESIRAQGIIQPIVVRNLAINEYEIIAGERRFRAAKLAGLTHIPAIVRELPDKAIVAMALIENIQREDLNPIEEAEALNQLLQEFEMTHQQVANAVGKSRTTVTNLLRLLSLSTDVREMLLTKKIEMGHARALLALTGTSQINMALKVTEKSLSVRETEQLIRSVQNLQSSNTTQIKKQTSPGIIDIQDQLSTNYSAKVLLQQNEKGRGKIIIKYKSQHHLNEILDLLNK